MVVYGAFLHGIFVENSCCFVLIFLIQQVPQLQLSKIYLYNYKAWQAKQYCHENLWFLMNDRACIGSESLDIFQDARRDSQLLQIPIHSKTAFSH